MNPVSLDVRNFLSHASTQVTYDGVRLATYVGPNGAGKSALASDALEYVLFGEARGRGDDLVSLGQTDMSVALEFLFGGERYRIVRGRTTKGGGKPFLELAIADFAGDAVRIWRPLTRETVRDTQAAIEELLHVDRETFRSAVLLGQGDAHRFANASPKDRKLVIGSILNLERYQAAEARCREEGRELQAALGAERLQVDRLDGRLAERPHLDAELARSSEAVAQSEADITGATATREVLEARARELGQQLGQSEAAQRDVERITGELRELLGRHNRAQEREQAAVRTIAASEAALVDAGAVAAAVARLDALRDDVDRWETKRRDDARLEAEIRAQLEAARNLEARHGEEHARWQERYEAARRNVDELAAMARDLKPCPKCGTELDQAGIREKYTIARSVFGRLEREQPPASVGAARERAAIARLESKRSELGYDAAAHEAARRAHIDATRTAARAEALEAHRSAAAQAELDREHSRQEVQEIAAAGQRAKAELEQARGRAAAWVSLRDEAASIDRQLTQGEAQLRDLGRIHSAALSAVASARAGLEELDRLAGERDTAAARADALEREIGLLRQLAGAFGVGGIPARIIEGVLPELAEYSNELLAQLRPGVTLELRAQRAKRDGSGLIEALDLVVRDAAGERPLALFSGGERMSVSLALAVGLSRLVARRAGTALRTLVIDEPDGLDADARRAFGQALRVLAHQGALERVVLVTHHEDLADVGDATYRVSKNGHGSVVTQVA